MATTTITALPPAIGLDGSEVIEIVQNGTSKKATSLQLSSLNPTTIQLDNNELLANISGSIAPPIGVTLSQYLDSAVTNTQGSIIYRDGTGWTSLTPGSAGQLLATGGTGANPSWSSSLPPSSAVTSISFGATGLTPISATTGAVTVGFGSSPTPAGIYSPAAAQIALSTSSTGRLFIDSAGNVGIGTNAPAYPFTVKPSASGTSTAGILSYDSGSGGTNTNVYFLANNFNNDAFGDGFYGQYARGTASSPAAVQLNDGLTYFGAGGFDGTTTVFPAYVGFLVDNTVSTGSVPTSIIFHTGTAANPPERMRITSAGNVGIGNSAANATTSLRIASNITGATTAFGVVENGVVQSGVTTAAVPFHSSASLAAAAFTTNSLIHFYADPAAGGAGSTVNNNIGFFAEDTLRTAGGATVNNSFGFYGNIVAGANRWNLFMGGTAQNAFQGNVRIGSTTAPTVALDVTGAALISTTLGVTTSVTSPLVIGGTGAASSLTLQSTSGVGTTDSILFKTGNNGAVTALTIASNGNATFLSTSTTAIGTLSLTNALSVANGGTGATSANAGLTNLTTYTATATAAGTTVLTNTSTYFQFFTGATTQTITLPVTSTLALGWSYHIVNNSTGNLTVNSSGGNLVITVLPGTTAMVTCVLTSGTTAASWEAGYTDFAAVTGTGNVVLATSPTIATPTITTSATVPLVIGGTAVGSTLTLQSTSGAGTTDSVVVKTGNNGAVTAATFNTAGVATSTNWYNTATQTATNTATLTAAQITSPFLLGTPTATASYTLPTASALDTALGTPPVETGWEFVVFTTAAFAITLLTNTGWTLVGSMATGATANSFARYRVRKTAATPTFTIYRIS